MTAEFDLLISGGTCVLPGGRAQADIGVGGGRISAVGDLLGRSAVERSRLLERKARAEAGRPETHPAWRDAETARRATARLLGVASRLKRHVHLLHATTAEEMELLASHREIASVEVTPQHLTLVAPECYERLSTLAQMNPPGWPVLTLLRGQVVARDGRVVGPPRGTPLRFVNGEGR